MASFLSLSDVRKYFFTADAPPLEVIAGLTLEQKPGEVVSIVGASGSGKTTLLRIIAGLERADRGSVKLNDRPVTGPGPERAMVFQQFGLLPWLSVMDNIVFGLRPLGLSRDESRFRAADVLARVGLSGFETFLPKQLSGGMQQRVGIARALAVRPALMLCDEPFASVDTLTRQTMQTDLQKVVQDEHTAVLLVTHDIEEAIFLGDRVVVLSSRPARIISLIDIDMKRPREHAVRTSTQFQDLREHIWQLLQGRH